MTLPPSARWYLRCVALAASVTLAVTVWRAQSAGQAGSAHAAQGAPGLLLIGELLLLMVVAQHFPLSLAPKRKLDFGIAVHFATLLIAGVPLAIALVGLGEGIGQGTLMPRRDPTSGKRLRGVHGALFNTSQVMLAVAAAGAVQHLAGARLPALGVAAAGATLYLVNSAAVAIMAGLQLGRNPLVLWRQGRRWSSLQGAGFLTLGYFAGAAATREPWVPLLMVLPAAMTYVSLKRTTEAEASIRARDDFFGVAAHELRNPLTGLRGYTQLLLRTLEEQNGHVDPQRLDKSLHMIDRQCTRVCRLIDQLMDLSYIDADKLVLDREDVDLSAMVTELAAVLQPLALGYEVGVYAPQPVYARVDRMRLEQVLTNLVINAAKHAQTGERIDVEVYQESAERVVLAVRDYGKGIPVQQRERIFERYYQGSGERRTVGLGIGLYVVQQIVARHQGSVRVEAPAGGGARFVVTLPAAWPAASPAARLATPAAGAPAQAAPVGARVVLV